MFFRKLLSFHLQDSQISQNTYLRVGFLVYCLCCLAFMQKHLPACPSGSLLTRPSRHFSFLAGGRDAVPGQCGAQPWGEVHSAGSQEVFSLQWPQPALDGAAAPHTWEPAAVMCPRQCLVTAGPKSLPEPALYQSQPPPSPGCISLPTLGPSLFSPPGFLIICGVGSWGSSPSFKDF